jgi:CubicO group peptidase (beta-lactamase class C family)
MKIQMLAAAIGGLFALASIGCTKTQSKPTRMITPLSSAPSIQLASSSQLDAALAAIANDSAKPLASLSVLAVREGAVVYKRQFGHKFIDSAKPENNKLADVETLYRVASISKMITTLGVMKLVEEGKLDLDRDISDYLGYKLRNPNFPDDAITVRMLLSHTSSLRDEGGYYWEAKNQIKDVLLPGGKLYDKGGTYKDAVWGKQGKPGAYFQYANLPWGVLGTVMERASGERFDRLMARTVFTPMGIAGGFNPAEFSKETLANTATLYRKRTEVNGKEIWDTDTKAPWVPQVDDYSKTAPVPRAGADYVIGSNGTAFGPQGAARLSAAGLGKIMLMLMNGGTHEGTQILQKKSVDMMLSRQWQYDAKIKNGASGESGFDGQNKLFNAWGLGNQHFLDISGANQGDRLVEGGGFKAVGHLGDAWGLTSAIVFDPVTKNGMIFLIGGPGFNPDTNKGKYSAMYRHEEQILNALYRHAIIER